MPAATRYGGSSLVNPTTAAAGLVPNPAGLTPRALHPSVRGALLLCGRYVPGCTDQRVTDGNANEADNKKPHPALLLSGNLFIHADDERHPLRLAAQNFHHYPKVKVIGLLSCDHRVQDAPDTPS